MVKQPRGSSVVVECDRAAPRGKTGWLTTPLNLILKGCRGRIDLIDFGLGKSASRIAAPAEAARAAYAGSTTREAASAGVDHILSAAIDAFVITVEALVAGLLKLSVHCHVACPLNWLLWNGAGVWIGEKESVSIVL